MPAALIAVSVILPAALVALSGRYLRRSPRFIVWGAVSSLISCPFITSDIFGNISLSSPEAFASSVSHPLLWAALAASVSSAFGTLLPCMAVSRLGREEMDLYTVLSIASGHAASPVIWIYGIKAVYAAFSGSYTDIFGRDPSHDAAAAAVMLVLLFAAAVCVVYSVRDAEYLPAFAVFASFSAAVFSVMLSTASSAVTAVSALCAAGLSLEAFLLARKDIRKGPRQEH